MKTLAEILSVIGFAILILGLVSFASNDKFFNSSAPDHIKHFVILFWAVSIPGGVTMVALSKVIRRL
jgi:hypothetical protein